MKQLWMAGACALALTAGQAWAQDNAEVDTAGTDAMVDGPVSETVVPETAKPPTTEPQATQPGEKQAEEAVVPAPERHGPAPSNLNLSVGLGVSNFRGDLNNNLNPGASWDVRAGFNNDDYVSGELAYVGSANGVDNADNDLGPNVDGTALTSMGDALVRFNATTKRSWQPFAGAGLGMLRLNVRDEDTTVDRGSALTVPLTAGVDFYASKRLLIGGRLNYRILTDVVDNDIPSGDQWNAGLNVGATF